MRIMKKRIIHLIMLLIVGAVMTPPLEAQTLKIAGKDIPLTSSFSDTRFTDCMKSGTVSFDKDRMRLTFKNVVIEATSSGGNALYFNGDHIILAFEGKNTFKGIYHGIRINVTNYCYFEAADYDNPPYVEVSTERQPDTNGSVYHAIWFSGDGGVGINGIYLKATAYSQAITGNNNNKMEVSRSWIEARSTNGNPAINKWKSFEIGDELFLQEGKFDSSKKYFVNGSTAMSAVKIFPNLTVGGNIVNTAYSEDTYSWSVSPVGKTGGSIYYDKDTKELVFNQVTGTFGNVNLPAPFSQFLVYNMNIDNLQVVVKGTNTIKTNANVTDNNGYTTGGYGIYSDKDITIIGASDDYTKDVFTFTGDNGFTGSDNCRLMFKYLTVNVSGDSPITAFNQLSFSGCAVTATDKYGNEALYAPNKFLIFDCDIAGGYYYNGHFYGKDGKTLSKAVIKKTKAEYDMYILGRKLTDVNIADFAAPGWKSGTLSYDYTPQRLILTDVEIDATSTNTDAYGIEFNKMELYFRGTSTIKTGNKPALYLKSDVTITSAQKTEAQIYSHKASACELTANRTLTLNAGDESQIQFSGLAGGIKGAASTTLKMQKSKAAYPIYSTDDATPAFTVGKFVNADSPGFDFMNLVAYKAAYWDASKKMPMRNGGKLATAVLLWPVQAVYDIAIGGKKFNDVNCTGMAAPFFTKEGDAQATFDYSTTTVTLDNAYIDLYPTGNDAVGINMDDFTAESGSATLSVKGENYINTVSGGTALETFGNLTITSATKDFKSSLELHSNKGVGLNLHFSSGQMNRWLVIKDKVYLKVTGLAAKKGIACATYDAPHGKVTIDDATVDVFYGGIGQIQSLSLFNCAYLYPEGATFDTNQHVVVDADGNLLSSKLQIRSITDAVSPVYFEGIAIDEEHFPDASFRNYVSANFDTDKNGYLKKSEIAAVETINLQGVSVSNTTGLGGLENFTNLKELNISGLYLFGIDLSPFTLLERLYASKNQFMNGINLSYNVNLTYADLSSCRLGNLDLSMNTKLTYLSVSLNGIKVTEMGNLIKSLPTLTQPSGNMANLFLDGNEVTHAQYKKAEDKGWAPYVDKYYDSGSIAIDEAHFPDANFRNYVATEIDTDKDGFLSDSERNNVYSMYLSKKDISNLAGIEWFPNVQKLYCDNNNITSLNLSNLTKLNIVYCHQNKISGTNMEAFINSLPVVSGGGLYVFDFVEIETEGNFITPDQAELAKAKGWTVFAREPVPSIDFYLFYGLVPGDVNQDGNVNIGDIMAVINMMASGKNASIADVNLDGNVNVGDIMAVINIMASK